MLLSAFADRQKWYLFKMWQGVIGLSPVVARNLLFIIIMIIFTNVWILSFGQVVECCNWRWISNDFCHFFNCACKIHFGAPSKLGKGWVISFHNLRFILYFWYGRKQKCKWIFKIRQSISTSINVLKWHYAHIST